MKNNTLSAYKKKKIIEGFADGLTASQSTHRLKINRNTINKYYTKLREIIADYQNYEKLYYLNQAAGKDEKTFYRYITKCQYGRKKDSHVYLGIFELSSRVFCDIFENSEENLKKLLSNYQKIGTDSALYRSTPLKQYGQQHLLKMQIPADQLPEPSDKILQNLPLEFDRYLKEYMKKFFGVKKEQLHLYIKEAEFRYNYKLVSIEKKLMPLYSIL